MILNGKIFYVKLNYGLNKADYIFTFNFLFFDYYYNNYI
jgi:hypothetical protein